MFTGIVTHIGKVEEKTQTRLTITAPADLLKKLSDGISISVDGACLTVVSKDAKSFSIDFMPETAKKTIIHYLEKGNEVNLELPATSETLFSGHIVQGHIDAVGKIKSMEKEGNSVIFSFAIPQPLSKYIVEKGSIAVNGISLTIISVGKDYFTVGIIPHTWKKTMLHASKVDDFVNLEVDALAKYVEKIIGKK